VQPKKGAIIGTLRAVSRSCERHAEVIPEVIVSSRPHLVAIPNKVGEQSWTEISGKINRIASLPSESRADPKYQKEKHEGSKIARAEIAVIFQGEDHEHEHRTRNELREELASLRHKWLGVRAEDASSRVISGNSSNVGAAFVNINGGFVVAVDDSSTTEAACNLSASICRPLTPGELPEYTIRERDGRIEVSSCATCSIYPEHDPYAPAERRRVSPSLRR
jgi:hypothetical protein